MSLPCMEGPKPNELGVPRNQTNMARWGLRPDNENVRCNCDAIQDSNHLLICVMLERHYRMRDLFFGNDKAVVAINYRKMSV